MQTNVITYQTADGRKISLTRPQIRALEAADEWPRSARGEEYATVSHGLHSGTPAADGSTDVPEILDAAK